MKILLVEDDSLKRKQINNYLEEQLHFTVLNASSLNEGLRKMVRESIDVILLDMSLPTFSLADSENFNPYGGIKFLEEMKRKNNQTPVIIITQYEIIGEGNNKKSSVDIDNECKELFDNYIDMIIYSSSLQWEDRLKKDLEKV